MRYIEAEDGVQGLAPVPAGSQTIEERLDNDFCSTDLPDRWLL